MTSLFIQMVAERTLSTVMCSIAQTNKTLKIKTLKIKRENIIILVSSCQINRPDKEQNGNNILNTHVDHYCSYRQPQ